VPLFRLSQEIAFPSPDLAGDEGLLAIGGDLSPERLVAAYSTGIFPWYSQGDPILWHSPDPRMILYPSDFKQSESLSRLLKSGRFELRIDADFPSVIQACASTPRPGQAGTWITDEMQDAYIELHRLGLAHSFETYSEGVLVGGLYGVSLGRAFFGESMYHQARDASKYALASLVAFAKGHHFAFIDAQQPTPHLASLGAAPIPRCEFLKQLAASQAAATLQGSWSSLQYP